MVSFGRILSARVRTVMDFSVSFVMAGLAFLLYWFSEMFLYQEAVINGSVYDVSAYAEWILLLGCIFFVLGAAGFISSLFSGLLQKKEKNVLEAKD